MSRVQREKTESRQLKTGEFCHLASLCFSHAIESLVTVRNSILERRHQIRFGGLAFFDALHRTVYAQRLRAEAVIRISDVADELAEATHLGCRFEGVVGFRHLL